MDYYNFFICFAFILYFFAMGVVQLVNKKPFGLKPALYTEESKTKYAKVSGVLFILIALATAALDLFGYSGYFEILSAFRNMPIAAYVVAGCALFIFLVILIISRIVIPKKIKK